jgi:FHIPEP family
MLMLTEYIRMELGRLIAFRATGGPRDLPVVLVDVQVEQHIRQSIKQTPTGNFLALPPEEIGHLVDRLVDTVGETPRTPLVVVASMDIRGKREQAPRWQLASSRRRPTEVPRMSQQMTALTVHAHASHGTPYIRLFSRFLCAQSRKVIAGGCSQTTLDQYGQDT